MLRYDPVRFALSVARGGCLQVSCRAINDFVACLSGFTHPIERIGFEDVAMSQDAPSLTALFCNPHPRLEN
jgi:hypothetical protein